MEKIFAGLNDNASSFSEKDLAQVVDNHNAAITIALATPVPNDWAEYHRKGVAYLMERREIFQALSAVHDDPVKSLAALQYLNAFEVEFTQYLKEYSEIIKGATQ